MTMPPRRPDQRLINTSRAGVGPGPDQGVVVGRVVIVFGPSGAVGGIFIYSPGTTPALGNPPIASITAGTSDPFGNPVPSGFTLTDFSIQTEIAGQARFKVDQFGNILVFNSSGALIYLLAPSGDGYFLYKDTGSATQGDLSISNVVVAGTDQFGNPYESGIVSYQGDVSGTLNAVQIDDGVINFLSYSSGWIVDATLYSAATGLVTTVPLLAADPSNAAIAETWHAMSLQNSWANSGSGPDGQYRLLASPPNTVELIGDLSAGTITSGTTIATLPTSYRPASAQGFLANYPNATPGSITNPLAAHLAINSSGVITPQALTGLAPAGTRVTFHAFISLDG